MPEPLLWLIISYEFDFTYTHRNIIQHYDGQGKELNTERKCLVCIFQFTLKYTYIKICIKYYCTLSIPYVWREKMLLATHLI